MTRDSRSVVFVFWDPMFHVNFAYSANVQAKGEILIDTFANRVSLGKKATGEVIVACRPQNLIEAIKTRIIIPSFK